MKKPIRVLHVLQRMEAGGTQSLLMNIYRNIDREKVQFDFFVEYDYKEFYDDEIASLGGKVYYSNVRVDKNIFKFQRQLEKVIKDNDYKIVHVHTYSIGYFALKTAKKCGVPVRIAHSHSNNMTKDYKMYLKKIMQKLYLKYATDYMACSKEAGEYLFRGKKYEVLNNAIDSTKFIFNMDIRNKIRTELNFNDCFIVGHVGRLKIEKNHKFLISVFEKIKEKKANAKLILLGDGPLKKELQDYIDTKGLKDDVLLLGNKENINEYLQAMDIFIFPSLYEGLGIVAIESQAAGTPIIISDGVPDETIITPICKKLPLNDSIENWANKAIELSENKIAHTNTQLDIINSGFDLNSTINWIQKYYLNK